MLAQVRVHRIDLRARQPLARDIRLVGRDDQAEAVLAQALECRGRVGKDDHLLDGVGRIRLAVADIGLVQHAIAIEEHGARHALAGARSTPSHLVCFAFSAGCVTSRCQMTAWNASECGVTASGLTVGTMHTASPTLAV